jgi:hypothetical protein
MPRKATQETSLDETFSSLRIIGGHDVLPDRLGKYPDLDVDGGARIRKSLVAIGDAVFRGEATVEGNLMILGNTNFQTINSNIIDTSCVLVSGIKVVGPQQPAIPDLVNLTMTAPVPAANIVQISGSGDDSNINGNFSNVVATLNLALGVLRTHGLMA